MPTVLQTHSTFPQNVYSNVDEITDRAEGKKKILALRWEDYLSVVGIHRNNDTLTPLGNLASCVLTITKKTVKTAPLSVLFTSVD